MKHRRAIGVVLFLLAIAAATAQTEVPAAEVVLDQAIEAVGGRAAIEAVTSRIMRGTLEIPAIGIKAPMTTWAAAPDKFFMQAESAAIGKLVSGTDGQVYWENNAMTGPRIKEGTERDAAVRETRFHAELEWRTLYKEVVNRGQASIGGRDCWQIELIPAEGKPEIRYYDIADHLMRKAESTVVSEMGEIKVESFPEDYRVVDGVLIPHRVRQVLMGVQEMVLAIETCESNVAIPDSIFALPAEIVSMTTTAK